MIIYKAGNIVVVRVRNKPDIAYPFIFTDRMTKFSNKAFEIKSVKQYIGQEKIQQLTLEDREQCGVGRYTFSQPMLYPTMELI